MVDRTQTTRPYISAGMARLLRPSSKLSEYIFAGVERDTRGIDLSDSERFNYYPATPMAMVSWVFEGTLHMVKTCETTNNKSEVFENVDAVKLSNPLPRLVFSGPQSKPSVSWSPGSITAMSVAFYPEAILQFLRCPMAALCDQNLPLEDVASDELLAVCEQLFTRDSSQQPFLAFQVCFEPLCQGATAIRAATRIEHWISKLTSRVAYSNAGQCLRQFQRRIKLWTGQNHRDLQIFCRVEHVMAYQRYTTDTLELDLAGLAHDAGFADQSHMGREIRRVTGLSPARLNSLMQRDEAFWFYRLIDGQFEKR